MENERKKMPRLPRVYIEEILYYVTSKSGHNQNLFIDHGDYNTYTSLLAAYKRQYGFKLFAYVLLPTHLHMLIELKNNNPISNIMHDVNSLYTKTYNSRYAKKGHLFEERFSALLAEKEPYLLPLTRHIHLSPKRTKIATDPKNYPYSSHPKFLDPAKRLYPDMRDEIEEAFGILKGREEAFEKYVIDAEPKEAEEFGKTLHKKRILGSKAFADEIKKAIEEAVEQQKKAAMPRRVRVLYLLLGGAVMVVLSIMGWASYRQTTSLKSSFDKTIAVYDRTLEMLKRERDMAMRANQDTEQYAWKIKLTETALEEAKKEKTEALTAGKEMEGYAWEIELTQIGGHQAAFEKTDTISFKDNQIDSLNLSQEGFARSYYSKSEIDSGVIWQTMQRNDKGEIVSWRGKWDGKIMRGILSRRSANGTATDFSFASTGEGIKR